MRTVYKYTLKAEGITKVKLPVGATALKTMRTEDGIQLWMLLDPDEEKKSRFFLVHRTGAQLPDSIEDCNFIGMPSIITVSSQGGEQKIRTLTEHVWEVSIKTALGIKAIQTK